MNLPVFLANIKWTDEFPSEIKDIDKREISKCYISLVEKNIINFDENSKKHLEFRIEDNPSFIYEMFENAIDNSESRNDFIEILLNIYPSKTIISFYITSALNKELPLDLDVLDTMYEKASFSSVSNLILNKLLLANNNISEEIIEYLKIVNLIDYNNLDRTTLEDLYNNTLCMGDSSQETPYSSHLKNVMKKIIS